MKAVKKDYFHHKSEDHVLEKNSSQDEEECKENFKANDDDNAEKLSDNSWDEDNKAFIDDE